MIGPRFLLAGVAASAFLAAPLARVAADEKDAKLDTLILKVDATYKSVQDIQRDFLDLRARVTRLEDELNRRSAVASESISMKADYDKLQTMEADIQAMRVRLKQMEEDVRLTKIKLNPPLFPIVPETSSSYKWDITTPLLGSVKLINEYVTPMSIIVNGLSYRLEPGEIRFVEVPAGKFTYQVPSLQWAVQERSIAAGDIKPIRIHLDTRP